MIYDNKTLTDLSLEELKIHETKLIQDLNLSIKYWLTTYCDNESWAYKVEVNVECLKQVRKYIFKSL